MPSIISVNCHTVLADKAYPRYGTEGQLKFFYLAQWYIEILQVTMPTLGVFGLHRYLAGPWQGLCRVLLAPGAMQV